MRLIAVVCLALAACTAGPVDLRSSAADAADAAAPTEAAPAPAPEPVLVLVPGTASAGVAPVGQVPAGGALPIRDLSGDGSAGPVQVSVDGPFEVDGRMGPLAPWEHRELVVRYTGPVDAAAHPRGVATLTVDDTIRRVLLTASVVDRALPPVQWEPGAIGVTGVAALPSAPFPFKGHPYDDRAVLVFVPAAFTGTGPMDVVVHLHGHSTTARDEATQHRLREQLHASGRRAVLVVPQGPIDARDGHFGRLMVGGGLRRLVEDVVALLHRDGLTREARLGQVVLSAHSGGFHAVAMMLERGGVDVAEVHLHDAFYGFEPTFRAFVEGGGRLRSSWTGGVTERYNRKLAQRLRERSVAFSTDGGPEGLVRSDVTLWRTPWRHSDCVHGGETWRLWLEASVLAAAELD